MPLKRSYSDSGETADLKKGRWTADEDAILRDYVTNHGECNWNAVRRCTGLARDSKSCRFRWVEHLRPQLKKDAFSLEEERRILELHSKWGNKWSRMALQLPGRTDNEIKNFWNSRKRKLERANQPLYPPDIEKQMLNNTTPGGFDTADSSIKKCSYGRGFSNLDAFGIPKIDDFTYPPLPLPPFSIPILPSQFTQDGNIGFPDSHVDLPGNSAGLSAGLPGNFETHDGLIGNSQIGYHAGLIGSSQIGYHPGLADNSQIGYQAGLIRKSQIGFHDGSGSSQIGYHAGSGSSQMGYHAGLTGNSQIGYHAGLTENPQIGYQAGLTGNSQIGYQAGLTGNSQFGYHNGSMGSSQFGYHTGLTGTSQIDYHTGLTKNSQIGYQAGLNNDIPYNQYPSNPEPVSTAPEPELPSIQFTDILVSPDSVSSLGCAEPSVPADQKSNLQNQSGLAEPIPTPKPEETSDWVSVYANLNRPEDFLNEFLGLQDTIETTRQTPFARHHGSPFG